MKGTLLWTVLNSPRLSLLETRDRKCHLFSRHLLLLVTHPTLVAAATKEAFTCPKNSPVNQRLKSSVMLRAVSPHSALFTSICFQEFHPSRGLSVEGRPALVTFERQSLSSPTGFCIHTSISAFRECLLGRLTLNFHPFLFFFWRLLSWECRTLSRYMPSPHGTMQPFNLWTYTLNRFYYSPVTSYC